MATFTMSLVVGAQTFSYTESPTNTNAQRIGPAYRKLLKLPAEATDQEVWAALGASVAAGIKQNVLEQEKDDAEAAIVLTPFP